MSKYNFKPAVREQVPLLIGMVGPSGGGKTMSALEVATGIQSVMGGEIYGIDSEARRMLHYADDYKFHHLDFAPPFSSVNYLEALQAAVDCGARTVIVDSASHEHEGEGGYLDFHERELDRMAGDDWKKRESANWRAWAKPAAARRRFINGLLQMHVNVIFCFRAKERLIQVPDPENPRKSKLVQTGWQAIAGDEFVFEMTHRFLLPPGAQGIPDFGEEAWKWGVPKLPKEHRQFFAHGNVQLNRDVGAMLAQWAQGGDERGPLLRKIESAARQRGGAGFKEAWGKLTHDQKGIIGREERDRLIAVAQETDDALSKAKAPTKNVLLERIKVAQTHAVLDMIHEDINELSDENERNELLSELEAARERI